MSLFGAMTASVSGIGAQGQAISVISDNLANTNTIGYKASRTLFSQMVTNSGASGTLYNSGGVGTAVQRAQMTQGSFITSTSKTDLAISGNGFFRVADAKINTTATTQYFTRAGSFAEDKEGYLVNPDGFYLQGWRVNPTSGAIENIQDPVAIELQSVGVSAKQTMNFAIKANLNNTESISGIYGAGEALNTSLQKTLDDPTLSDYVADVRVYDAQGGARDMTIQFTKRSANTWDWQLVASATDIQAGTGTLSADGDRIRVGGGTLEFNTNGGSLKSATGTGVNVQWANGVDASPLTMDFGQYTGGKAMDAATSTGLGRANGVINVSVEKPSGSAGALTDATDYEIEYGPAAGQITLNGETQTINLPSTGNQEIYFSNSGVRLTVDSDFMDPIPTIGDTVATLRTLTTLALEDGIGTDGLTQLAAAYNTSGVVQDGFGAGTLASISIDADGFVNGSFTNGEVKKLYKVALAAFQNPSGLEVVSGSLLRSTDASGQALLKEPGIGGTGRIVSGSLEGSTTDIAGEFSNMIVAQRAFQASSKVITTVDQMLNELLQLR
ncbi:MAG: flagellar hook protein FlgE [Alphaproteobacteria bacterium]|nr:MAG: flagellar hook protein FlgE [Alphaproteobacteria bacterium]